MVTIDRQETSMGLRIGDRVLAHWAHDVYWYPAVLRDLQKGRYYLHFDDGDKEWTTAQNLRPLDVRPGERVFARYHGGLGYVPARVTQQESEHLLVRYVNDEVEWLNVSMIRVAPPCAHTKTWTVGDRVLACWGLDHFWYAGTIQAQEDDQFQIQFDDGDQNWTIAPFLRELQFEVGDRIYCRRPRGNYEPATIMHVLDEDQVILELDSGTTETVSFGHLRVIITSGDDGFERYAGMDHEFKNGDAVLANVEGTIYWYPAKIVDCQFRQYNVAFETGELHWLGETEVMPLDIEVGDRVQCRMGHGDYLAAQVLRIQSDRIQVESFQNQRLWTTLANLRVSR